MSRENVEIVRRLFDAVARHDTAAITSLYDPQVELDTSRSPWTRLVGGGDVYRGHDGLRRLFTARNEEWASITDDIEELIDEGVHVVSVSIMRGRGRSSGVAVDLPQYGVWTIRDGKIVRAAWFPTREEALAAVGLRE